ncbi:hypothetical protein [Chitinophaga sp.]|uniref:hypothetical protein n=1 Tax=Chitinophaga sp. TaxID=1869181 RepID=UPI0031D86007
MGLVQKAQKTFLTINGNGKIAQRLKQPVDGCITRQIKEGKTIYENQFDGIEGRITNLYFNTHEEYGRFFNVVIDNEYVLQLNAGNRYYYSFVFALPNVDFSKPVKLTPWRKEVEGKAKMSLYVNQGGDKSIEWFFTRENNHGMPDMVKIKVKGKETWDDSARQEWLEKYLQENIFPALVNAGASTVDTGIEAAADDKDGLPF